MNRMVFDGCLYGLQLLDTRYAVRYLLKKLGIEVSEPTRDICCGRPSSFIGDMAGKDKLVNISVSGWGRTQGPVDEVLVSCPGCGTALMDSADVARRSIEVTHFIELLPEKMEFLRKSGLGEVNARVTVHYPCHLSRGMGVDNAVMMDVLNAIRGLEIIEMEGAGSCCGGSGGLRASDPEVAEALRSRKIRNALVTNADLIVTACPRCEISLSEALAEVVADEDADPALRKMAANMKVVSLAFLVAFGMDDFTKNLERVVAEAKERRAARKAAEEGII